MTSPFLLPNERVFPFIQQDYPDWHKGRQQFGLWYIEINSPIIVDYCQRIQKQFDNFLQPNYQRQFHITLFINGFWVKNKQLSDEFDKNQLDLHIQALTSLQLSTFDLTLNKINSFKNVLLIHIDDNNHQLVKIRQILQLFSDEISPTSYYPHITLGFYQQNFLGQKIFDKIRQINLQNLEFTVDKLIFGTYQSQELQGKLTPIYEFWLK